MKNMKVKTALSKLFSQVNTAFGMLQNLTRSQRLCLLQAALVVVFGLCIVVVLFKGHLPSLFVGLLAIGGALYLEGLIDRK